MSQGLHPRPSDAPMAETSLTPLETNALKWVLVCERLELDPDYTSALDLLRLITQSPAPVETMPNTLSANRSD